MDCNTRLNEMFIMYANHKKDFSQNKVPANPEKDVCVYFKVKNKLGMCKCKCKIKPNKERENLSLLCDSKRKNPFFFYFACGT